ncbi:hypothetical protein CR513_10741, partial [Mucuna pruriens]
MKKNLIYVYVLDNCDYFFHLNNKIVTLSYDYVVVGFGVLHYDLYMLDVFSIADTRENSVVNFIAHLGHVSKERREKLIKEGILHVLNFLDLDTCVDCIKGELARCVDYIISPCALRFYISRSLYLYSYILGPYTYNFYDA